MLEFYQNLPQAIDPIAFSVGFFSIRWYPLMYLAGFAAVFLLLRRRILRKEGSLASISLVLDWMIYSAAGLLAGARLGYVLLYDFQYYFQNPLAILSPYDFSTGVWTGIFGMSYFGGAAGVILASWIFTRRRRIDFWSWADFVIPAIPAGYFFGRIGNFLNSELFGRVTAAPWGMHFTKGDPALRHPSQLYEALGEGAILFWILWARRNKKNRPGESLALYLFFYGLFRLGIEFFREPDFGSTLWGGFLTQNQCLSVLLIGAGILLGVILSKREKAL